MTKDCEALFLGPHPDDVELFCGGTVLRLLASGSRVAIVDLTRGEMGTLGDAATRQAECEAATRALGLEPEDRTNLDLPDTGLIADDAMVDMVVAELRRIRPRLFFAPHEHDVHPDHTAAAAIARRAFFLAGLAKYAPELGAPYRPNALLQFPGNDHVEPSFCVDISDFIAAKTAIVECYATQVNVSDRSHFAKRLDPLTRSAVRDRYFGSQLGCAAAEPFITPGPLLVHNLSSLFGS